ncbi:hypothetical protein [Kocuria sp.]|uniref:hypothetical protein n=1 Tax=Kocuria sp. TaxID=1871328 RepID=UPI0026DF89AE|nr:hypothetical protein [Kocuria sp.]MDO5618013.1 hypothetical protein [Kocuria sp.]
MPTSEPMNPAEVSRSLERIEAAVTSMDEKLDARPTWKDVERVMNARREAHEADIRRLETDLQEHTETADRHIKWIESRVLELESWQAWVVRIVLAAVIAAVLGVVLIEDFGPTIG